MWCVGSVCGQPVYEGTSIRISTSKGKELVSFAFNEACNFGPHEFRYVMRSDLLHALLNIVPAKVSPTLARSHMAAFGFLGLRRALGD
jgi:hypothetical protein